MLSSENGNYFLFLFLNIHALIDFDQRLKSTGLTYSVIPKPQDLAAQLKSASCNFCLKVQETTSALKICELGKENSIAFTIYEYKKEKNYYEQFFTS